MNASSLTRTLTRTLTLTLLLALAGLAPAAAASPIEGSWSVFTTPEGGPPPFHGLLSFMPGGAVIASAQGDIIELPSGLSLATAGHGAWKQTGLRTFASSFRQIIYAVDGAHEGDALIRIAVTLNKSRTRFTGTVEGQILDADGNLLFETAGTLNATRIEP